MELSRSTPLIPTVIHAPILSCRELGVNNGTGITGYIYSTAQPGTSSMSQIYRTDKVDKATRNSTTGATGTVLQDNGDHVYTTKAAFEMSLTPGRPHIEGVRTGWRQEIVRGFVRELSPNAGGAAAPARSAPALSTAAMSLTAGFSTSSSSNMAGVSARSDLPVLIAPANGWSSDGSRPDSDDDASREFLSNDARRPISSSPCQIGLASRQGSTTGADPAVVDSVFAEWKDLVELLP